ncbi:MAG: ABC transporter permease [Candidatus Bathyarchaeia archaeon]
MNVVDVLSYAFGAIKLRKLRAALTTLGVVIGIAAIVALLSFSQGFQNTITAQLQKGFATNTLIVSPREALGGGAESTLLISDTNIIDHIEKCDGISGDNAKNMLRQHKQHNRNDQRDRCKLRKIQEHLRKPTKQFHSYWRKNT